MTSKLIDSLVTTAPLSAVFADTAVLSAMVEFEVALASAEARAGVITVAAADAIRHAARVESIDLEALVRDARVSATPSIPFVNALTAQVRAESADAAAFVHWGATSQDVFDTAIVLCLKRARPILAADHEHLLRALLTLSERHASTVMLGRTLLQAATPTTFGLKVAGWAAALARSWATVSAAFDAALVFQFGGGAGTLAVLGPKGPDVERGLAVDLGLACPDAPWHAHRDRFARLVAAFGLYAGGLSKLATDIALLMQGEVAEVSERGGGSSTMPHKRNPSGCAVVLASAGRLPGLVASSLEAMTQAHERAIGGWQAEASIVSDAAQACGSALAAAVDVIDGLMVSAARMHANIAATGGVVFAERATFLLAAHMSRDDASRLVARALATSRDSGQSFRDALATMPEIVRALAPETLATIDAPELYLGSAEVFRRRLVATATASLI